MFLFNNLSELSQLQTLSKKDMVFSTRFLMKFLIAKCHLSQELSTEEKEVTLTLAQKLSQPSHTKMIDEIAMHKDSYQLIDFIKEQHPEFLKVVKQSTFVSSKNYGTTSL